MSRFECQQIFRFVVAGSGLPAAVNDPYPFKSQCTDRGLVRFSFFSQPLIVQFGQYDELTICYNDLLNTYQRWLTDLTNIAIRNGMCHPEIRHSHCLTVSVLHFPEAGAVTAIVPQYLYRIVHGKKWPDPLFSLDDLRTTLETNDELLFTHAGLEGILLSECVRLKQGRLAVLPSQATLLGHHRPEAR